MCLCGNVCFPVLTLGADNAFKFDLSTNAGRHFTLSIPPLYSTTTNEGGVCRFTVLSEQEQVIHVQIGDSIVAELSVPQMRASELELPLYKVQTHDITHTGVLSDSIIRNRAINVSAKHRFILLVEVFAGDQYGYFPAIPTALLGTITVLAAPPEISYNTETRRLPQQFYITAIQDSTVLNMQFGGKIGSHANHSDELMSERTVLLHRGNTYVLTSGGQHHDISGTYIHSTTPFSLVSTAYGSHTVEDKEFVDFCITQAQARFFEYTFCGVSDPIHESSSYIIAQTSNVFQPVVLDTSRVRIDEQFTGLFYTIERLDVSKKQAPYRLGSVNGVNGNIVREYATDSSFHIALCIPGSHIQQFTQRYLLYPTTRHGKHCLFHTRVNRTPLNMILTFRFMTM